MKQHLALILFFLLQSHYLLAHGDDFIRTNGIHFMLNGVPFYANGFNAYWLMYEASDLSSRPNVSATLRQAASHGLTIARTWAFSDGVYRPLQISPGSYNEQMFKGLDFVVSEARRYGMKLILSFVNNFDDFGGKKQYVNWARRRGQNLDSADDFFTNSLVKGFYKNHIKSVVNRRNTITGLVYKNDPTIMAWELMNEARCTSDPSGRTIQAWIQEMASYVKSIDQNHLLEAGLEGFYGRSSKRMTGINPGSNLGTDFITNNLIHEIDFATVHSYPDIWLPSFSEQQRHSFLNKWLNTHIQDAQAILRKPLLFAEFGKCSKDRNFEPSQRDKFFYLVYSRIYKSASRGGVAAGGLFWQLLADGMDSFQDGCGIILDKDRSTANVIAHEAFKMYRVRKTFSRVMRYRMWSRARARRNP